jgi:FlaA1/EpsC-like NDP-sugar epimerase
VGSCGEALVLDMGQPVRIADVARQLIEMEGRSIEIVYTGLRPGEKMHEELFGHDESGLSRVHPLISHVPVPALDEKDVEQLTDLQVLQASTIVDNSARGGEMQSVA